MFFCFCLSPLWICLGRRRARMLVNGRSWIFLVHSRCLSLPTLLISSAGALCSTARPLWLVGVCLSPVCRCQKEGGYGQSQNTMEVWMTELNGAQQI